MFYSFFLFSSSLSFFFQPGQFTFNRYLLSASYGLGTVLGSEVAAGKQIIIFAPYRIYY